MAPVNTVIADVSPTGGMQLVAWSPSALGFSANHPSDHLLWFSREGDVIEEPAERRPLAMLDVDGGACTMIEQHSGTHNVRSLWWRTAEQLVPVRERVASSVQFVTIADGAALLLDPQHRRFELVCVNELPLAIPLPAAFGESSGASPLSMNVLPDHTVVLCDGGRAYWWSLPELLEAVSAREIDWRYRWRFAFGDAAARVSGIVTYVGQWRTTIEVGTAAASRRLPFGPTSLHCGEEVTLVDLLWDALGRTQYREVIRADGTRERLPGGPELIQCETTSVQPLVIPPPNKVEIPATIVTLVRILRAEGMLGDADESVVLDLIDGAQWPESEYEFLVSYYGEAVHGSSRAARDGFVWVDWRFGSAEDYLAVLVDRLDAPLPLRVVEDGVLEGPLGRETIARYIEGDDLYDLVRALDRACATSGEPPVRFLTVSSGDGVAFAYFVMPPDRAERLRALFS